MTTDRRRPFRRPGTTATALVTWAVFVAVFVLLALQLRAGRDPVLGAPTASAAANSGKARIMPKGRIAFI